MNKFKNLFYLFLLAGILIFLLGVYMKLNETISSGFTYSKSGKSGIGEINGDGTIAISIFIIILSFIILYQHKVNLKERETLFPNEIKKKERKSAKKAK